MGQLTREERRRVFLLQEKSRSAMMSALTSAHATPRDARPSRPRRLWLVKTAMIATLLAGGWFAYQAVEFHAPASVMEALLPRL